MSKIYITAPSGKEAEYDEDQIQSMWEQGLIQNGALYWKEGMSNWKPLVDYFSATDTQLSSPPPIPENGTTKCSFTKDPRPLTSFLIAMLWVSVGAEVIYMLSDFLQMSLLSQDSLTPAEADANDALQGLVAIAYLIVFIITGVAFLKWIYRANLNSRGFGAKDMKFTPGWSIGYYFIPILNLYKPYHAMKEIWQVSKSPENWQAQEASDLLTWWWALWLLAGFVDQALFRLSWDAETPDALQAVTVVSIVSCLISIPLCMVAITLVKKISGRQLELTKIA